MDNRIRIRNGRQTTRITVTITCKQRDSLRALSDSSGLNASELVRCALVQFLQRPYIFLPAEYTNDKRDI